MVKDIKEEAKKNISELVNRFKKFESQFMEGREFETQIKLINELFEALGWDVRGKKDFDEVRNEVKIKEGRADYSFKINGVTKFVLEAKKPSVNIDDKRTWFQAVTYGYNKGLAFAGLTNFKRLIVFNVESDEKDLEKVKVLDLTCDEFVTEFAKLWWLSKEGIANGILEKEAEQRGAKRKRLPVDEQLFKDLVYWRTKLYKNIKKNNQDLPEQEIDENIQVLLNRLIFIRFCEDKGYSEKVLLENLHLWEQDKKTSLWNSLRGIFDQFDDDYNSGLFEKRTCDTFNIDDKELKEIIYDLYNSQEHSIAYKFDALSADILGSVYEQFLGSIVYRKEQGIYYTPAYIVDYIIRNTLCDILNKKPINLDKIRVLDPACGSGSFLIKALDYFIGYQNKRGDISQATLSTDNSEVMYSRKANILKKNIFGVDLDRKAVEIAQLSLFLKIAENRKTLPNIHENIQLGNSLIDNKSIDENAFEWDKQFKSVMGEGGFNAIIGNPPYIAWSKINRQERRFFDKGTYLNMNYKCRPNHEDAQPNYYLFFIVRGNKELSSEGKLSFIIPQEWLYNDYALDFRNYLLNQFGNIKIVQFNPNFKVFKHFSETVGTNSLIIILSKKGNRELDYGYIEDMDENIVKQKLSTNSFDIKLTKKYTEMYNRRWKFNETRIENIRTKISNLKQLSLLQDNSYFEVKGGFQPPVEQSKHFEIGLKEYNQLSPKEKEVVFNLVFDAKSIKKYSPIQRGRFWIIANDIDTEIELKKEYPSIFKILSDKPIKHNKEWWYFPNIRNFEIIKRCSLKILSPRTGKGPSFTLDEYKSVFKGTNTMIISKELNAKYVIGILNSHLSDFWYSTSGNEYHGGKTKKYEPDKVKRDTIPIKIVSETEQQPFIKLVERELSLNKQLGAIEGNSIDTKKKIKEEIDKIDTEIDELVYKLYGITDSEKKIIEESLK